MEAVPVDCSRQNYSLPGEGCVYDTYYVRSCS